MKTLMILIVAAGLSAGDRNDSGVERTKITLVLAASCYIEPSRGGE